ncbi:MAG: hypothetical protein K2N94_06620 [Lachnospiraceae bacterium]|nr:hypothetical protein [Lachnospiraceae bacterium]
MRKIVMQRIGLAQGLTVISISHRMNFLNEADKIYELKGGKLRECEGNTFISFS